MRNSARPTHKAFYGLSLSIALGAFAQLATAAPLNTKPLPHEADKAKRFDQGEAVAPELTRFRGRHDYKDEEKQKKADADKALQDADVAKAKAVDAARKDRADQVAAYKKREQESIDANNEGVQLGRQGHWEQAIQAHEKAIQLQPGNKEFLINLSAARCAFGQSRMASGDYQSAAYLFRKALIAAPENSLAGKLLIQDLKKSGINPSSADARLTLGDQLAAASDIEGASIEYQAAMQLEDSGRTYVKMGDMSYRYGQVAAATSWYRQAIGKDPNYGPAYRQLGFMQLAQRDLTGGAASLRKACILDPHDVTASGALVELWRKQVAANPNYAENHLGLAGALQLSGDFKGAESEYDKVQAIDPSNSSLPAGRNSLDHAIKHSQAEHCRLAADTLFNQGLRREALAEIGQAVRLEPRNASYQFLLAECLEANGDYNGAHQAYLTCVVIDPTNNKEAAARMARMEHSAPPRASYPSAPQAQPTREQFEGAPAATASEAPAAQPSQNSVSQIDPAALAKIAKAENEKDYTTAISQLKDLVSADVNNSDVHHRLALDLMASGDEAEAISEFRIASALVPNRKDYASDLAQALSAHKRSLMSSSGTAGNGIVATPTQAANATGAN